MPALMIRLAKKSALLSEDGGDESRFEHKAAASALKALDKLARELGTAPISQFISEDPENVYDLVDDEDEAASVLSKLAPVRWSEPTEALPTIKGLLGHLRKHDDLPGIKNVAQVIADLRDIETILIYSTNKKAKFRLYKEF